MLAFVIMLLLLIVSSVLSLTKPLQQAITILSASTAKGKESSSSFSDKAQSCIVNLHVLAGVWVVRSFVCRSFGKILFSNLVSIVI